MGRNYDLIAKNSDLAELTEVFRKALQDFIDSAREQVGVMNNAFEKNGMTGDDDLISANRDALLNNVKEITISLNDLSNLDERLSIKQDEYKKLIEDLWNGIQG